MEETKKIEKKYCAFLPNIDYRVFDSPENNNSLIFNLIFKFNFLLETYLKEENDLTPEGNFVDILAYVKTKNYCTKTWLVGFYINKDLFPFDTKERNRKTQKIKFSFDNLIEDIERKKDLMKQLFPNIKNDPMKKYLEKETIIYEIYYETLKIMSKLEKKPEKQTINLPPEKSQESFLEIKQKSIDLKSLRNDNSKIKIKGKIMNIPSCWNSYGIFCWNDFESYLKESIYDCLSETMNTSQDITNLKTMLKELKIPELISKEEYLDIEHPFYNLLKRTAIEILQRKIWDLEQEKKILFQGRKIKIPSSWEEYDIKDYNSFEEVVKCAMMRQFSKNNKLTNEVIERIESEKIMDYVTKEKELDLNSKSHIALIKGIMIKIKKQCNM